MPGAEITIITQGGGGNRINVEYGSAYSVAAGDTAENQGAGTKTLNFTGDVTGLAVFDLAGNSGYEFAEPGIVVVSQ